MRHLKKFNAKKLAFLTTYVTMQKGVTLPTLQSPFWFINAAAKKNSQI